MEHKIQCKCINYRIYKIRNRVEYCRYSRSGNANENGILVIQDLTYKPKEVNYLLQLDLPFLIQIPIIPVFTAMKMMYFIISEYLLLLPRSKNVYYNKISVQERH